MSNYETQAPVTTQDPLYSGPRRGGIHVERGSAETRPFYLTSEFVVSLICVIGIAIAAAVAQDLDSHRASALIAGIVAAYTLSRGIAKSGTRSHTYDPREHMSLGRDNGH
jgi:hypothetical protein